MDISCVNVLPSLHTVLPRIAFNHTIFDEKIRVGKVFARSIQQKEQDIETRAGHGHGAQETPN